MVVFRYYVVKDIVSREDVYGVGLKRNMRRERFFGVGFLFLFGS